MNDNIDLFGKILEKFGAYYYCVGDMVICCLNGTVNRVKDAECVVGYSIPTYASYRPYVSCDNCKYFGYLHLAGLGIGEPFCRKHAEWHRWKEVQCSKYKRKWWKFWIGKPL